MRTAGPKTLSDEELIRVCAFTRTEEILLLSGCLGALLTAVIAFVTLLIAGNAGSPLTLGAVSICAALFLALHLTARPKRRYREELDYRSGKAPFSHYVAEAQAELAGGQPDWIALFTVRHLPHGDFSWLWIGLSEGQPPAAHASLRVSRASPPLLARADWDLAAEDVNELLALVKGLDFATLTDVRSFVMDGAPCRLAILRREPRALAEAACNLSGFRDGEPEQPTMLVSSTLHRIAQQGRLAS